MKVYRYIVTTCVVILMTTIMAVIPVAAQNGAVPVNGTFFTQVFFGEGCPSPLGVCSAGTVTGDLTGDVFVTTLTLDITDTANGQIIRYTTAITITTPDGILSGTSKGIINTNTGRQSATFTLESGTGVYEGYRGVLNVNGTNNAATGQEILDFRGVLQP